MKKIFNIENSCAPLALHYVSGVDEETVLNVCKFHGFTEDEGMADEEWMEAAKELKLHVRSIFEGSLRLRSFISKNKQGLFLIRTEDHIFALDNSLIIDPGAKFYGRYPGLGRLVKQAWRVTKAD